MGDQEKLPQKAIPAAVKSMIVDTLGGCIQVSWDPESAATPFGQLVFFAEFLEVGGLFDARVAECPLIYNSPNAPKKSDVLGTWNLSILAGHRRYAHVTALRSDSVSLQILGMSKIVSEDALRRALGKIPEAEGTEWMRKYLFKSVAAACHTPWILDIDATIKTLFGHQEGAEVCYNQHKPGRLSHAYHAYWMGNPRLLPDVEVTAGNTTASYHAQPGLNLVLGALSAKQRPSLVRGDRSALFIVGANGYVGRALFASASKAGTAIGTSSSGGGCLLPLHLDAPSEFDYGKIRPGDVVLLTAAISAPDICAREHNRAWAVNVTGTSSFIQSVMDRGARVVFFSSDTVYGEREDEFDETAASNPAGEYAEMKREVEQRFSGNPSFKAIRLSYVFSREDKFSRYLAGCAERNEEADLFHPFFRAIVYRGDVVEGAMVLAAHWDDIPEQVLNFGGPRVLSRVEFAECLRETHLHDLRFKVTEAGADFFKNRPRVIAMTSPVFARLLGRPLRTLCEAAHLEFASSFNAERVL